MNPRDRLIKKLVEILDGIIIDPLKGVILTPKKKRQIAEFNKMEQKLSRAGVKSKKQKS